MCEVVQSSALLPENVSQCRPRCVLKHCSHAIPSKWPVLKSHFRLAQITAIVEVQQLATTVWHLSKWPSPLFCPLDSLSFAYLKIFIYLWLRDLITFYCYRDAFAWSSWTQITGTWGGHYPHNLDWKRQYNPTELYQDYVIILRLILF